MRLLFIYQNKNTIKTCNLTLVKYRIRCNLTEPVQQLIFRFENQFYKFKTENINMFIQY